MDLEKRPPLDERGPEQPPAAPPPQAEGCLAVAIRIPVRIVVLVLVVPVRLVWDALAVCGRFLYLRGLRPVGRAFAWLGRTLIVTPLKWLMERVITPIALGVTTVTEWLLKAVFVWPWVGLWRYVLVPVGKGLAWLGHVLLVVPAVWLYASVLTPVGHAIAWLARGIAAGATAAGRGIGAALVWLLKAVFVWPWVGLWRYVLVPVGKGLAWLGHVLLVVPAVWLYVSVLTPVGHAIAWLARGIGAVLGALGRWIFVVPAVALWRWVLAPVGRGIAVVAREISDALGHAWRIAGHISLVVGRFLGRLLRWLFVDPVRWVYRAVLTPVGHVLRDGVWRPAAQAVKDAGRATRQALAAARQSVRDARADVRRMLFGAPKERVPVGAAAAEPVAVPVARREPDTPGTRTLGSSTTALTKD
ncbi:hypothetical protein ABZ916_18840 [Streptomyces sp. NPDC046853]|uniref:hypothetical protein n=1 Tax=Streptomyces sp. NPDC046853 TaxID=3154920 RepID=UPI003404E04A